MCKTMTTRDAMHYIREAPQQTPLGQSVSSARLPFPEVGTTEGGRQMTLNL